MTLRRGAAGRRFELKSSWSDPGALGWCRGAGHAQGWLEERDKKDHPIVHKGKEEREEMIGIYKSVQ